MSVVNGRFKSWLQGRGGTPLYKPHTVGMSPKGEGFYAVDFSHFGLESDIVFEGTTGVYERNE